MITAYLDESGNLTDKNPFFITAVVCLNDERIPTRLIKRLRRVLGRRKGKIGKEIKLNKEISLSGIDLRKIEFVDSETNDGIKLADFIAGFYGQFYNLK